MDHGWGDEGKSSSCHSGSDGRWGKNGVLAWDDSMIPHVLDTCLMIPDLKLNSASEI